MSYDISGTKDTLSEQTQRNAFCKPKGNTNSALGRPIAITVALIPSRPIHTEPNPCVKLRWPLLSFVFQAFRSSLQMPSS